MKTTLKQIRAAGPCGMHLNDGERTGYLKLRHHLGKGYGDDTPIDITTVLDSNGLDDAHWCFRAVHGQDRVIRLYGVWCAREVQHLMKDERSTNALDVSERHANGQATQEELVAAGDAAGDAWAAAWAAAGAARAARAAAFETARAPAWSAARAARAARAAAWAAAWAAGDARDARDAAGDAAWDAARDAQANELRRVCACIGACEDPYPFIGVRQAEGASA